MNFSPRLEQESIDLAIARQRLWIEMQLGKARRQNFRQELNKRLHLVSVDEVAANFPERNGPDARTPARRLQKPIFSQHEGVFV